MNDSNNQIKWKEAKANAVNSGILGLVDALELTTKDISNTGSYIGGMNGLLVSELAKLNERIDSFNKSSESLTTKALDLTKWIMIATVVSSVGTLVVAIDVFVNWFIK